MARLLSLLGAVALGWAFSTLLQAQVDLPPFTPNVVDTTLDLGTPGIERVNLTIQALRGQSDIRAAVLILPTLDGESIESLSERAFRTWELGEKGKDNGLLLVIARDDRKVRIETGYGLEGDLPDAICKRVLEAEFNHRMREGKLEEAIDAVLRTLSAIRAKEIDPQALRVPQPPPLPEESGEDVFDLSAGLTVWGAYCFFVLVPPLIWSRLKGRKVTKLEAALDKKARRELAEASGATKKPAPWFLRPFLMVNPGIFFFLGIGFWRPENLLAIILLGSGALVALIVWGYRSSTRHYNSPEAFMAFLAQQKKEAKAREEQLIREGYMELGPDGKARYTEKWHERERENASRRSSRSSSSSSSDSDSGSSSSSGGGRSGGGGASSSW